MTFLISHVISCVYVSKYVRSPNPNLRLIVIMKVEVITWLRKPVTWWVGAPQPNSPSRRCGYNIYFLRLNLRLRKHAVLQVGALNLVRHGEQDWCLQVLLKGRNKIFHLSRDIGWPHRLTNMWLSKWEPFNKSYKFDTYWSCGSGECFTFLFCLMISRDCMIKALSDLIVYNGISSNSNEILNNKCQMPKVIYGEIVVKTLKNCEKQKCSATCLSQIDIITSFKTWGRRYNPIPPLL